MHSLLLLQDWDNLEDQVKIIEDAIQQGVDGIILHPIDSKHGDRHDYNQKSRRSKYSCCMYRNSCSKIDALKEQVLTTKQPAYSLHIMLLNR